MKPIAAPSPSITVVLLIAGLVGWGTVVQRYRQFASDLLQDYRAATAFAVGADSLYSGTIPQDEVFAKLGTFRFEHPPTNALLFVPLTAVDYHTAFVIQSLLSLLALAAIIGIALLENGWSAHWFGMALGIGMCWYPFLYGVGTGQSSWLMAGLLVVGWQRDRRGRWFGAGLCFGLATLIKVFPGLIVLPLVLQRSWKTLAVMTLTIALALTISIGRVGWGDHRHFVTDVAPSYLERFGGFPLNMSLPSIASKLFDAPTLDPEGRPYLQPVVELPVFAHRLNWLLRIGVITFLTVRLWRWSTSNDRRQHSLHRFSLTCLAMLLAAPTTWMHLFGVLIVPIVHCIRPGGLATNKQLLMIVVLLSIPDVWLARQLAELAAPNPVWAPAALLLNLPTLALMLLARQLLQSGDAENQSAGIVSN